MLKLMLWLAILILILLMPDISSSAARSALAIWGLDVVPSLFPYMVLCRLIADRLRRKSLPAFPVIAVLGLLGGSPSGAAAISSYAQQGGFSRRRLYALCALTGTTSPMFFGHDAPLNIDMNLCQSLLLSHFGGALLAFFVVLLFVPSAESAASSLDASYDSDASPIVQSVFAVLNVGGCIVFFSVIAACLSASLAWMPSQFPRYTEIAGGVHVLSPSAFDTRSRAAACRSDRLQRLFYSCSKCYVFKRLRHKAPSSDASCPPAFGSVRLPDGTVSEKPLVKHLSETIECPPLDSAGLRLTAFQNCRSFLLCIIPIVTKNNHLPFLFRQA